MKLRTPKTVKALVVAGCASLVSLTGVANRTDKNPNSQLVKPSCHGLCSWRHV